jgi:hypothetical protein
MKVFVAIIAALSLSGCAQWNKLSEGEKVALAVSGAILVGANIIKNSEGDVINNNCVSTKSLKTGCSEWIK